MSWSRDADKSRKVCGQCKRSETQNHTLEATESFASVQSTNCDMRRFWVPEYGGMAAVGSLRGGGFRATDKARREDEDGRGFGTGSWSKAKKDKGRWWAGRL